MINTKKELLTAIAYAFIFTIFFHRHQGLGLNVFIIEILALGSILLFEKEQLRQSNLIFFAGGVAITAAAVVFSYSAYAIVVNFLAVFVFTGILIYPQAKSLGTSLRLAFYNVRGAQVVFLSRFLALVGKKAKDQSKLRRIHIFAIPILILFFFIAIYRGSSPFFDRLIVSISSFFGTIFSGIFKDMDFLVLFTFVLGLLINNLVFLHIPKGNLVDKDVSATDKLGRLKDGKSKKFRWNALKEEYKVGVFLLVLLNLTLLVVNVLDVYWVWFNFNWNGQYLKQFVHEGTYLLILSILCSIAIVLYFFRGNLNFYGKTNLLRSLSYVWITQNALLTVSVAVRNLHYIHYFALAYKRIALLIFLLLTLYGLYTVYRKVSGKKSSFYLFRRNFLAMYVVLVLSSLINWDNVIAKYNFDNALYSFVEFQYLSEFPDKSLPYLDKTESELIAIKKLQKTKFPFEKYDMDEDTYKKSVDLKKERFIKRWESQSLLSWNLPEYLAYEKVKK
jgi:hypothetical protein